METTGESCYCGDGCGLALPATRQGCLCCVAGDGEVFVLLATVRNLGDCRGRHVERTEGGGIVRPVELEGKINNTSSFVYFNQFNWFDHKLSPEPTVAVKAWPQSFRCRLHFHRASVSRLQPVHKR